jgi:hypothetical protein
LLAISATCPLWRSEPAWSRAAIQAFSGILRIAGADESRELVADGVPQVPLAEVVDHVVCRAGRAVLGVDLVEREIQHGDAFETLPPPIVNMLKDTTLDLRFRTLPFLLSYRLSGAFADRG